MSDYDFDGPRKLDRTRTISLLLNAAGYLLMIATLTWGGTRFWQMAQAPAAGSAPSVSASPAGDGVAVFALFVAGLAAGVLMIGAGELLRRLDSLQIVMEDTGGTSAPSFIPPGSAFGTAEADKLDEVVLLLREQRDISMLDENERKLRLANLAQVTVEKLQREVPELLMEHNWVEARQRVMNARSRFPGRSEWDALDRQIEKERAQLESRDIESAERQAQELMTLGAWDRVADVLAELQRRHPDSPRAQALVQRVREARDRVESEQRQRQMAAVQELVKNREWVKAYETANAMIRNYPKSQEAQALRMDLPLLRGNAEIATRKQFETHYAELIRQHRYHEALQMARELVEKYPGSPQAEALKPQIQKLEQRTGTGY